MTVDTHPPSDIDRMADQIVQAVMAHRLAPGSKLSETRMAETFSVSRTKIRQVLSVLARTGLVQLVPNRGAYLVSPSVAQARQILAARRLIEPELVRRVAVTRSPQALARLRAHLARESEARQTGDRRRLIQLTGDFHMLLAELADNSYLAKSMSELCPLTCLVIALYDLPNTPACPEDDHERLVDAIAASDPDAAIALMTSHLGHIEQALKLDDDTIEDIAWSSLLG